MSVPDSPVASSRLFKPLRIGRITLQHRIALAPLSRHRADDDHVPLSFCKDYYAQRAAVPGTLLITEGTFPSPQGAGLEHVPGLWNQDQVRVWKEIVDAVHARGCFIFAQLWALGRVAAQETAKRHGKSVVSSSAVPVPADQFYSGGDRPEPKAMTEAEIEKMIGEYVTAARNAVEGAGFDGVEIHGANGYLIDQFTQDTCNRRTDKWGGSIENRSRFAVEIARRVSQAVGSDRTAFRLSPWSTFQGMRMEDPKPQFLHLVKGLKGLNLAYLHLIGPRTDGVFDNDREREDGNDCFIQEWGDTSPIILAGGSKPTSGATTVNETYPDRNVVVAYGRYFTSNPDLVYRIRKGLKFRHYEPAFFYAHKEPKGYVTYPYSQQYNDEFTNQNIRARL